MTNTRRHVARPVMRVLLLVLADIVAVGIASALAVAIREMGYSFGPMGRGAETIFSIGYLRSRHFMLALVISMAVTGNYGPGDSRRSANRMLTAVSLATALQLWATVWLVPLPVSVVRYGATVVVIWAFVLGARMTLNSVLLKIYRRRGSRPRVLLIGRDRDCREMLRRPIFNSLDGMHVVDTITIDDLRDTSGPQPVHRLDELEYILHAHRADHAVICGYPGRAVIGRVVKAATVSECQVLSWNPNFDFSGVQPTLVTRLGQPFVEWRAPALRWWQMVMKRGVDIIVSFVALLLLSPVLLLIAALVRFTSRGPAVFGHRRLGRFGQTFKCYKFRSMYPDAEERLRSDPALYEEYVRNDYKLPPERDNRITPIGKFLRKTSLDELPQLWNVLNGDMSLVGPRPIVPDELRHYDREGMLFLSLKPGMTGEWQVSGRSSVAYPERAFMELEYVQDWSLWADLSILVRTLPAVLIQRGAH